MLWLPGRVPGEREPALHGAPQKFQQAGAFNFWRDLYFFVVRKWTTFINVKTAISHLTARFFILILFHPITQEMKIFPAFHAATVSSNPQLTDLLSSPSPSPVNRKTFVGSGLRNSKASDFPAWIWISGSGRAPSVPQGERAWAGEG